MPHPAPSSSTLSFLTLLDLTKAANVATPLGGEEDRARAKYITNPKLASLLVVRQWNRAWGREELPDVPRHALADVLPYPRSCIIRDR
jgi:hypothetical protein